MHWSATEFNWTDLSSQWGSVASLIDSRNKLRPNHRRISQTQVGLNRYEWHNRRRYVCGLWPTPLWSVGRRRLRLALLWSVATFSDMASAFLMFTDRCSMPSNVTIPSKASVSNYTSPFSLPQDSLALKIVKSVKHYRSLYIVMNETSNMWMRPATGLSWNSTPFNKWTIKHITLVNTLSTKQHI